MIYTYPLLDESWDIHWLRPKIYYEIGVFPDSISIFPPDVLIEFKTELTVQQKEQLDLAMAKTDLGVSSTTSFKLTADIHPINLQDTVIKAIGKKPLYYCAEGQILNLIFFEKLTIQEITKVKNALGNIWQ